MTSLAESCPDLPDCIIARLLESWEIPHKTNYRMYKKFETAEILPSGKILVFDAVV